MAIHSIASQLMLLGVINKGGSSYIIEGEVIGNTKELKRGQRVVLKHCMGFLELIGCNEFSTEANNLRNLKINLVDQHKCANFPIYYGYTNECLFGSLEQLEQIIKQVRISDLFFYYANDSELGHHVYEQLLTRYSVDEILNIRNLLEIPNFAVIASLFPLTEKSAFSFKIQNFIEDEVEVRCSPNIIISTINGTSLQDDPHLIIDKELLFELVYTNASLINYNGKVFGDTNLGNIMIETVVLPRLYKVHSTYYCLTGHQRLVIIDAQVLIEARGVRDLTGNISSRCDDDSLDIIDIIQAQDNIQDVMGYVLREAFADKIITESEVKMLMVAYPTIKVWSYP